MNTTTNTILNIIWSLSIIVFYLAAILLFLKQQNKQFKYYLNLTNSKKKTVTFNKNLIKTGVPIISVKIHKDIFNFILDSGANVSYFNKEDFYKYFTIEKDIQEQSISFLNSKGLSKEEVIVAMLEFEIEKLIFRTEFTILDLNDSMKQFNDSFNIPIHGLLGREFFSKYRWLLDFENNVVWLK
jgi:hypothetical protein